MGCFASIECVCTLWGSFEYVTVVSVYKQRHRKMVLSFKGAVLSAIHTQTTCPQNTAQNVKKTPFWTSITQEVTVVWRYQYYLTHVLLLVEHVWMAAVLTVGKQPAGIEKGMVVPCIRQWQAYTETVHIDGLAGTLLLLLRGLSQAQTDLRHDQPPSANIYHWMRSHVV